jgi:hypothetical protein
VALSAPYDSHTSSHLTPHTSHLTPHTSHLTPHTSHLTPHTSHLTPHTSHLTPHTPLPRFSIGDDFQWEAALEPFSLWDSLIEAVNADGRVRVQYSTLAELVGGSVTIVTVLLRVAALWLCNRNFPSHEMLWGFRQQHHSEMQVRARTARRGAAVERERRRSCAVCKR